MDYENLVKWDLDPQGVKGEPTRERSREEGVDYSKEGCKEEGEDDSGRPSSFVVDGDDGLRRARTRRRPHPPSFEVVEWGEGQ